MLADDLAICLADSAVRCEILVTVEDVPGQPHEIVRPRTRLEQDRHDVVQRLPRLSGKVVGLELKCRRIPADLARKRDDLSRRDECITVPSRLRPILRMYRKPPPTPLLAFGFAVHELLARRRNR